MKKPTSASMSFGGPAQQPKPETAPKKTTTAMLIRIPATTHNMLRQWALNEKTSANKIICEALNDFCVKKGKPPIA